MFVRKVKNSEGSSDKEAKQVKFTPEMIEEIKAALKEVEEGKIVPNDKFRELFVSK